MEDKKEQYSVSEAAEGTGMTTPRIMRRIKNETIKASKVGWVWIIPASEVEKLKKEMEEDGEDTEE